MVEKQMAESGNLPLKHAKILRGPYQMAIDVTNKCNFRCLHCYNRSGENPHIENELSYEEKIEFIKDIAKLRPYNLCFCGGEPMLEEQFLYEAAETLSSNGIMVSMVTNGSLITKEKAKKLKKAGVKRAQVSLDGARPETHERLRQFKGSFEKAKNAIKFFREAGFASVGVAFSPTSFNWYELEDVYNLIRFRSRLEHFGAFSNVQADGEIIVSPYIPISVGNIRKHKFSQYWDAGLIRAWEIPKIKELASKIISIEDMGKTKEDSPKVWYEENLEIDIIDDKLIKTEVTA